MSQPRKKQPVEFAPGQVLDDRFLLQKKLGSGGFATVWCAEDLASPQKQQLALKVPHTDLSPRSMQRFEREALILLRLRHENLIAVHHVALKHAPLYFAMDVVRGETLQSALLTLTSNNEQMRLDDVSLIVEQMVAALSVAHEAGVLHRDLKPANVLLFDSPPKLKVTDFGIARLLTTKTEAMTTMGRLIGTCMYIAPESVECSQEPTQAVDIFSLGCILFELLTTRRPWALDKQGRPQRYDKPVRPPLDGILRRIVKGKRPALTPLRPSVAALEPVVHRAMAIDPNDRYPSAQALLDDFKEALLQCEEQSPEPRASSLHRLLSSARLPALGIAPPSVHEHTEDGTVDAEHDFSSSPQLIATPRRDITPLIVAGFLLVSAISLAVLAYLISTPPPRRVVHTAPAAPITPAAVPQPLEPRALRPQTEPAPQPQALVEPKRRRARAAKKKRASEPRSAGPRLSVLRRRLRALEQGSVEGGLALDLAARIAKAATELKDPAQQRSIERQAHQSAMVGDLKGLRAALLSLEKALGKRHADQLR